MINYKHKLIILMSIYIITTCYLFGYWKNTIGYYGYQDIVNYEKYYENFRHDTTHWTTIYMLDIFGFKGWSIILSFILLPYAFYKYYQKRNSKQRERKVRVCRALTRSTNPYKSTYQFYLYSPMVFLTIQQSVYSQLLFTFFFLLYLRYEKIVFELLAIISHPAFSIILLVENTLKKKYKHVMLVLILGLSFYFLSNSYSGYNVLNKNAVNETPIFDTFLYMNPFNLYSMCFNGYNLIYMLVGLFFHNGRFLMFAVMLQYIKEPSKLGKIWGLFINFLVFYKLFTFI